ncbi:hypothetical protein I5Q41_02165 [Pseudomonas monteilii]|uniref:hypothetical protein n=1 Tax=Pseudomonas TaxID=286 RepID=UPI00048006B5|nr:MULTISPECIES: hypothetical protein [Pseudomonas]MBH3453498.1 hypothetical protein [Pseudomonas monteilii]PXX65821.1 hypothetical protein D906_02910 [Pseudomonas sp. LAIL14HWK12:I1]SOC98069.1 hypothetical protein SAMN05660198_03071 [Pseudomonas sp. LAIL14HWK12:I3]
MATSSKRELLDVLSKGDAMYGWGAMLALGRDSVNQLLEARFIERFRNQDFITPISGEYYGDTQSTELVVLDGLMLGPPALSFEKASGRTSTVTVVMELIAGRCSAQEKSPGSASRLRRSHELTQGMGYTLQMTAKLVVVPVPGSNQQQLAIDLGQATDPICNLAVTDQAARKMGQFILGQLQQQPAFEPLFGFINFSPIGNDVLTIDRVDPIAQKAPEGAGQGSQPQTDGAVLLLMQLRGDSDAGGIPDAFTYLLPRKEAPEVSNYGATLLLGKLRAKYSTYLASGLLAQVIMPEGYVVRFLEHEEFDPHDKVLFGDIRPGTGTCRLLPALSHIGAGQALSYEVSCDTGLYGWQAHDIISPRAAGAINNGTYTARPRGQLPSAQRVVVVSAKVSEEADAATRSALLIESSEPLSISPRVVVWYSGQGAITFTSNAAGNVEWKLLDEKMGELVKDADDSRRAVFTPDEGSVPLVRLQRVEVSVGEAKGHATVVMLRTEPRLQVTPHYVPRLAPGAGRLFALDDDPADRWEVFGPGNIDKETGEYKAPDQPDAEVSVIAAFSGPFAGVAIVEHYAGLAAQAMALQDRWKTLKEFSLSLNNKNRNMVFANGYQQVGIDIVIGTHSFTDSNGENVWDPVSNAELATLVLLDEIGNEIPYLTDDQHGIPGDSLEVWAAKKKRNHFDYYPVGSSDRASGVRGEEEGKRYVTVYVHSKVAEVARFTAKFQAYDRAWKNSYSDDNPDKEKGKIELEGVKLPLPNLAAFVWPKSGGKRVFEEDGSSTPTDTFNYWHRTTDYWSLSGNGIQLVEMNFESASMIKWESEQLAESFATYTGIAFKPRRPEEAPLMPEGVQYQAELQLLSQEPGIQVALDPKFKGQDRPSEGAMLITLDRVSNFNYWSPVKYRNKLDGAMNFTVTDNYGTKHKLKILFGGGTDGRNYLELGLQ